MKCSETQERLYDFLNHMLDKHASQKVQGHVNSCPHCRKEMDRLKKTIVFLDKWKVPDVPEGFEERVWKRVEKHLGTRIEEMPNLVINLRFFLKKLQWKIIRHNGTLITQPVLASRAARPHAPGPQRIINVKKGLEKCSLEAKVEGDKDGSVYLHLKVKDPLEGTNIPNIEILLRDDKNRKIQSQLSTDGTAYFERLAQDKYSIEIMMEEEIIGTIFLNFERA